jgi:hypothetical protein
LVTIPSFVIPHNSEKGDGNGRDESLKMFGKSTQIGCKQKLDLMSFLGSFQMYAKSACNFVMSTCRACTRAATTGQIFVKFHIVCFYENL